jgi:uncharacterized protein YbjT (DUF2867 family)
MKAFVAGATGKTGSQIVRLLVERDIPVRALVRNLEKAKDVLPPEVECVVGDVLKPASLEDAIADCTVVLSATGATPSFDVTQPYKVDCQGTKNLVDAAKAKGIEQFVMVSSLCVSKLFHPLNLFGLILVWKKKAEEYLQGSGLTYTIVRPGGLKDEDNADSIVMSSADTLFDGSIPRVKVAQVCVNAVMEPTADNKIVEIVARQDAPAHPIPDLFASV